jgi:phosphoglycolate phosphatase
MTPVDLIIFDLDGTLIDSRQDLVNAVNHARSHLGLKPLPYNVVVGAVGDGVQTLIARILGPENLHLKEAALKFFREFYREHLLDNTVAQPGVKEILKYYHAKKKAVLTNKSREFTLQILDALGMREAFETIECGDNHEERKPHPAGISRILTRYKIQAQQAVIVGDSPIDIQTGRSVGMHTCGVLEGFASPKILRQSRPDVLIESLVRMKEYFN